MSEITTIQEFADAIGDETKKLVVVDFFTTWCGPCKRIAPFYYSLAEKYHDVGFYKIDADKADVKAVTQACEVKSFPTFCIFIGGKYTSKVLGANESELEKAIRENL